MATLAETLTNLFGQVGRAFVPDAPIWSDPAFQTQSHPPADQGFIGPPAAPQPYVDFAPVTGDWVKVAQGNAFEDIGLYGNTEIDLNQADAYITEWLYDRPLDPGITDQVQQQFAWKYPDAFVTVAVEGNSLKIQFAAQAGGGRGVIGTVSDIFNFLKALIVLITAAIIAWVLWRIGKAADAVGQAATSTAAAVQQGVAQIGQTAKDALAKVGVASDALHSTSSEAIGLGVVAVGGVLLLLLMNSGDGKGRR